MWQKIRDRSSVGKTESVQWNGVGESGGCSVPNGKYYKSIRGRGFLQDVFHLSGLCPQHSD